MLESSFTLILKYSQTKELLDDFLFSHSNKTLMINLCQGTVEMTYALQIGCKSSKYVRKRKLLCNNEQSDTVNVWFIAQGVALFTEVAEVLEKFHLFTRF